MSEFVNSVTEAQQKLHADMRRDTDMRWSLLPVEPVKAPRHTPIWIWMIAVPLVGVAVIAAFRF